MSKRDIEKGIEIAAKADAAKMEKITRGLKAVAKKADTVAEDVEYVEDAVAEVFADMAKQEGVLLYGVKHVKNASALDDNEKRALVSCIYTLLSKHGQNSENQRQFYLSLENSTNITDRNDSFDFSKLENVDAHSDRVAMLKVICAFLFLGSNSFDFIRDKEELGWIYDIEPEKTINRILGTIEKEYDILGIEGTTSAYLLPVADEEMEGKMLEANTEAYEACEEKEEQPETEDYDLLSSIVNDHIEERDDFGKRIEDFAAIVKRELAKDFPRVSYDAVIGVNKLGNGYLIFTTYAMYIKEGNLITGSYKCLPYRNIDVSGIAMTEGRVKGTRKLIIPYVNDSGEAASITIDDSVLTEECLRDLLKDIAESDCQTATTDRFVKLFETDDETVKTLLSILIYILKQNNSSLSEPFLVAIYRDYFDEWNEIASSISSEGDLINAVSEFKSGIPYPSTNLACKHALHFVLRCVFATNRAYGRDATYLTDAADSAIRALDVKDMDDTAYNRLLSEYRISEPIGKTVNYEEVLSVLSDIDVEDKASISEGLENTLKYLNSKPQAVIKKNAQEATETIKEGFRKGGEKLSNIFIRDGKQEKTAEISGDESEKDSPVIACLEKSSIKLLLPEGYERMKLEKKVKAKLEKQMKAVEVYQKAVSTSGNIVMIFKTTADKAMNFSDTQRLIDAIHENLADNQGLIEVGAGKTKRSYDYIYSIVKTLQDSMAGVRYYLRMNIGSGDEIIEINADFTEQGMTGHREAMAMSFAISAGLVDLDGEGGEISGWMEDPYDPSYTRGVPMNLAERSGLDGLFPYNPLTQARELLLALINDEYVIIRKEASEEEKNSEDQSEAKEKTPEEKKAETTEFYRKLFAKAPELSRHTYPVEVE